MKKGVSPLIAVIMLIAFTMIVAGILATWTTNYARQQYATFQACSEAKAYIQGGSYDPSTQTLNVVVYNNGKVDLNFIVLLTYKDGTVTKYPTEFNVSAGDVRTFTLTGVSSNLQEVTIQSKECPGAQDLLQYTYIKGLS
ncbi:MAG: hypothetical protein DRP15_02485 [Candidatus Aenigmatarchaeota archaeon]|nr:MAG: hypothetical protein DRP15_02485 [Candidatus Aenigmarchaeota archaeon]